MKNIKLLNFVRDLVLLTSKQTSGLLRVRSVLAVLFFIILNFTFNTEHCEAQWVWQYPEYTGEKINSIHSFQWTPLSWAAGDGGLLLKTENGGINWQKQNSFTYANIVYITFINSITGWYQSNSFNQTILKGVYRTTNAGVNWQRISERDFSKMYFIDANTGWGTVGFVPYCWKTTDGGVNWTVQEQNTNIYDFCFINSQTGYFCGLKFNGFINKTTNKGSNWFQIGPDFSSAIKKVWFYDETNGYAIDDSLNFLKTTNGGINWTSNQPNISPNIISMKFFNLNTGIILYDSNCIKTTNGGNNWIAVDSGINTLYSYKAMTHNSADTFCIATAGAQIFRTVNSGQNWQNICGANNTILTDVDFVDVSTGWAVGSSGTVMKTTNSGNNWNITAPGNHYLSTVFFIDNQTGWISGGNTIFKTTNGGTNWIQKYSPLTFITYIYFFNSSTGWLLGNSLYKTTNGGENWIMKSPGSYFDYQHIQFINSQTGWVSGQNVAMYKTTNAGENWFALYDAGVTTKKGFCFINEQTGWAGFYENSSYKLYKTTNGGFNWTDKNIYLFPDALIFTDSLNGYWMEKKRYYKTTDGGNNWSQYYFLSGQEFNSIDFVNSETGWIVGKNSSIMKTVNGGVLVKKIENSLPSDFELGQNYPNPFNAVTSIKFKVTSVGHPDLSGRTVTIKVFDLLGREIKTLVNEKLNPGTYEVRFDAGNLPSGIYFYKMETEKFSQTKKLILLK